MEVFEKILKKYENKRIKSDCKALMKKMVKIRNLYCIRKDENSEK